jgi:signal transduction histidine kinase
MVATITEEDISINMAGSESQKYSLWLNIERVLPWFVLTILLVYTYAKFFEHPYSGFRVSSDGYVAFIFVKQNIQPTLELNDQITRIDSLLWQDFKGDYRKPIFENVQPGDVVTLTVKRNGQEITIPWKFPGPNPAEILDLLINEGWLAYVFWLCGTITLLSLRPKDERWRLLVAFNYLTAIWLTVGSGVSLYHIWGSPLLLRMSVWFCVPVYLRLHWLFPRKLTTIPNFVTIGIYILFGILAIMEWFQLLPVNLYLSGFLLAVLGSLLLLIAHFIFQADARSDLRLLLIVASLAFLPAIAIGIIAAFIALPSIAGIGLVGLPLLPLAYLYIAFRRRWGNWELRVNRFFTLYLFVVLLGILGLPIIVFLERSIQISNQVLAISLLSATLTAAAFIWAYPPFENFIERRVFGIPLPSKSLLEIYSNRITTSASVPDLARVLEQEIIPSLLVRQFIFLQSENGSQKVLFNLGVEEEQIPKAEEMTNLAAQAGMYRSPDLAEEDQLYPWIRLILPLKFGEQTIGFWLFGRRDPDDLYSQREIPILKSLANQTAVALSNLLQAERLKTLYAANIDRQEQEKRRLALDLHDRILNQIASLLAGEDELIFSPEFQKGVEELTTRLREIVSDLRSPMLDMGLKLACEDVAEKLAERSQPTLQVTVDVQSDGERRYPPNVESHLYRILQEACENTLKHAHAKTLKITVRLYPKKVELEVEDNGVGFDAGSSLKLDEIIRGKHFGLAGIVERADIIGAQVQVASTPGNGARVKVIWEGKEDI